VGRCKKNCRKEEEGLLNEDSVWQFIPFRASTKNKAEKSGRFLEGQKRAVNSPRLPRNSPRNNHKFTIRKASLFPKHPRKTPAKPQEMPLSPLLKFFRKKHLQIQN
jgi:hypothetical protein